MRATRIMGVATAVGVVVTSALHAGEMEGDRTYRYYSHLGGGVNWINLDDANNVLEDEGLPELDPFAGTVRLGMSVRKRRLVIGHEFDLLMWEDRFAGGNRVSLWSGYWTLDAGYNVLDPQAGRWTVYPLLQLGAGVFKLKVAERKRSFGDMLSDPVRGHDFVQVTFLPGVGGAVEYRVKTRKKGKDLLIGLRAGYLFDPNASDLWWDSGVEITGGPEPLLRGPYVHLVVGRGYTGLRKRFHKKGPGK